MENKKKKKERKKEDFKFVHLLICILSDKALGIPY